MNTLILDCSAGMSVYVCKDNAVFSHTDLNVKKHTDELLVTLDKLLIQAGVAVKDLHNICLAIGPGSFTGIRVAISIAKGLAVENNVKMFVVSNFDLYKKSEEKKSILVLEGFSNFVYAREICDDKIKDECISVDDLFVKIKANNANFDIMVQNEKLQNIFKNAEINANIAKNNTINCFFYKIKNNECIELNQISPIYLRASQAEIERQNRLAGESK